MKRTQFFKIDDIDLGFWGFAVNTGWGMELWGTLVKDKREYAFELEDILRTEMRREWPINYLGGARWN